MRCDQRKAYDVWFHGREPSEPFVGYLDGVRHEFHAVEHVNIGEGILCVRLVDGKPQYAQDHRLWYVGPLNSEIELRQEP